VSIQRIIAALSPQAAGLKQVYAELSEATHVGSVAMWTAWNAETGEAGGTGKVTYTTYPRWKRPSDALLACGYVLELAQAFTDTIEAILSHTTNGEAGNRQV
jgi:hypothetical protein